MFRTLLIALALTSVALGQKARVGRFTVEAHDLNTDPTVTVRAEEAPVVDVIRGIAKKLDLVVVGAEQISGDRRVDVYLVRRPTRDAIRWVLGSAGLRARITSTEIRLQEDVPAIPTREELLVNAVLGFERVLRAAPDQPDAPKLEMWLGDAQEKLGPAFYAQAVAAFIRIADDHPYCDLVADALLRAGRLLSAQGRWADAALRFSQLADSDATVHPYRPTALLELARALCHVGEGLADPAAMHEQAMKAIATLDALDRNHPSRESHVRRTRLLVRALAQTLDSDPMHAMQSLDLAQSYSPMGDRDAEVNAIRPLAFSRSGRHGDASTAWLRYAENLTGEARAEILRNAALEALEGDHELAVLFIHRMAKNEGYGDSLVDLKNIAEMRLELGGEVITHLDPQQGLTRALGLLDRRQFGQAVNALGRLFVQREQLDSESRLEMVKAYAMALEGHDMRPVCFDVLRRAVTEFPIESDRRQLYRLAADIHEREGHWNEAIEALKGNL
jgi:tetratricopeptide (TPR) repeat protein